MKLFSCDQCRARLYFENTTCLACQHELGYIPEGNDLTAIEAAADGTWRTLSPHHAQVAWRKCANYAEKGICNWMVRADDPNEFCRSCRMTRTIPDLTVAGNLPALARLEAAKRRLLYGLTSQGLLVVDQHQDPAHGLGFEFIADQPDQPALTGHADGLITINIREADPVERERAKSDLHESFRTLLGHLRHESGHYYWDRLVANGPRLEEVRALFGDDRQDYSEAMKRHYEHGAPADWNDRFVSAYASMHPWEDFAETWAHHLHMVDAVEIASHLGLSLGAPTAEVPQPDLRMTAPAGTALPFDELLAAWIPLTFASNCLTRSIGHQDWFPFVLSAPAIAKLRLVHALIDDARLGASVPLATPPPARGSGRVHSRGKAGHGRVAAQGAVQG
jgi:hypothetical protein